jgi:hypothetical protein
MYQQKLQPRDTLLLDKTEDELQCTVNDLQITTSEFDASLWLGKKKNHGLFYKRLYQQQKLYQ